MRVSREVRSSRSRFPQRLKPGALASTCGRPENRSFQGSFVSGRREGRPFQSSFLIRGLLGKVRGSYRRLLRAAVSWWPRLHNRWHADSHHGQHPCQFPPYDGRGGEQELLPRIIGLPDDAVPVVEVVEELRQLKRMFGRVGRLSGDDTLFDHLGGLSRSEPKLP